MPSERTCPSCHADLPPEDTTCAECDSLICWDCGSPNGTDEAFCRRCGVWLVGRGRPAVAIASATSSTATPPRPPTDATAATAAGVRATSGLVTSLPVSRPVGSHPAIGVAIRHARTQDHRRRWLVGTVAVALVAAGVVSVVALGQRSPDAAPPAVASATRSQAPSVASVDEPRDPTAAAASVAPRRSPAPRVVDAPVTTTVTTATTVTTSPPTPGSRSTTRDERTAVEVDPERAAGAGLPKTRMGWVCDDAIRVTDTRGARWSVDRVSFRAMNGFERVVLHLDRDGPGRAGATASGQSFATSAVQAFAPAAARPTSGRMTIGIELGGGIRSGLDLRGYRPSGLRTVRELSIYRTGSEARVLISVASDGCFRMRVPAWQLGSSPGAATAQLIVDVRR